jgi:thiamine biosynthesis lipoprotein
MTKGSRTIKYFISALLVLAGLILVIYVTLPNFGSSLFKKTDTSEVKNYSGTIIAMDTAVTSKIYGENCDAAGAQTEAKIAELDKMFSSFNADSDVSKLNAASGKTSVEIPKDLADILTSGISFGLESKGVIDITVDPLAKIWLKAIDDQTMPMQKDIDLAWPKVDYKKLVIEPATAQSSAKAYLEDPGTGVNLGSIAKGYTCDIVKKIYDKNNITSGTTAVGGNILVRGQKPDGEDFKVGIQDPFLMGDNIIGTITAPNKIVATAGDYERFFEQDGKRYCHILDLSTGYPIDTDKTQLTSVTIISDNGVYGDYLSTYVMIMGKDWLLKNIDSYSKAGCEIIAIDKEKNVYASKGVAGKINITNNEFIKNFDSSASNNVDVTETTNQSESKGYVGEIIVDGVVAKYVPLIADPVSSTNPQGMEAAQTEVIECAGAQFIVRKGLNPGIAFYKATCPDKICERAGYLTEPGQIAVCVPRRIVLKIV